MSSRRPQIILALAGLSIWLVAALPRGWGLLARDPHSLQGHALAGWLAGFLVFGAAFAVGLLPLPPNRARVLSLLAVQGLAVLVLGLTAPGPLDGALLAVIAAALPFHTSGRVALSWAVLQTVLYALTRMAIWAPLDAAVNALSFLAFELFAIGAALMAERERQGRELLARMNAELRATQSLLTDSSRVGERLRIARELHDSLGHHLTALSLNLEIASHLAAPPAKDHVESAKAMTRLLLGDLRSTVSDLRETHGRGLAGALEELARGIEAPRIHLAIPRELEPADALQVHALFRCAQEGLTNALRHAGARNVWIALEPAGDDIALSVRDDGRGLPSDAAPGNGLSGMRERLQELGGRLELGEQAGPGFSFRAIVPNVSRGLA